MGCSMYVIENGDIFVLLCTLVLRANRSDGMKSTHSVGALSQYVLKYVPMDLWTLSICPLT